MEKKTANDMTDWFNEEYGDEFDFTTITGALELMLINHRNAVIKEVTDQEIAHGLTRALDIVAGLQQDLKKG